MNEQLNRSLFLQTTVEWQEVENRKTVFTYPFTKGQLRGARADIHQRLNIENGYESRFASRFLFFLIFNDYEGDTLSFN